MLWQTAFIRGISWPVFIVLFSTKHPFCTVDVYAGDSVGEKAARKCTSPASKMTCPSVPPQDCEQTDDCGSWEKGKGSNYNFVPKPSAKSSPWAALVRACWGCLQQSWPIAMMLAALSCFQMLALIKRSLKSTSWWRRDIWKVNCCCSCRDQHRAERSPSDPLWALTHIWKA